MHRNSTCLALEMCSKNTKSISDRAMVISRAGHMELEHWKAATPATCGGQAHSGGPKTEVAFRKICQHQEEYQRGEGLSSLHRRKER